MDANARTRVRLGERRISLPPEASSSARARAEVRDLLAAVGRPAWVGPAELAVSELVTNVVLHAHTDAELIVVAYADLLRVEVRDSNPVLPAQRDYGRQATTGRGLALVAALSSRCGVTPEPGGKVIWFELTGEALEPSEEDLLELWADTEWDVPEMPYTPPTPHPALRAVALLRLPPTLWLAARQHHDALLRELVLYMAEHDDVGADLVSVDEARGAVSTAVIAAIDQVTSRDGTRRVLPAGHPSPLPEVPDRIDVTLALPAELGPAFAALQDALDTGERLAATGKLLTRPGLPEIIAIRDWACEQIQSQLQGVEATAWPGTDLERFETAADPYGDTPDWDLDAALAAGRGVVAADDANRIVGISDGLAAALGWTAADLVGRRVVTLIPPALREAHVAGFTRHLTTGEAHVLGVPLTLPVLHADGREVSCRFLIERPPPRRGRSIYLAWIQPVDDAPAATGM